MKTIIVASAFILAATAAAVPLNGKGSDPQVPPAFLADKLPVPAMKLVAPPQSNKDDKKTKSAKNARRGLPVKPPVKLPVTPPQAPKPEGAKAPKAPRDLPVKPPVKLPVSPPKPEAPKAPRDLPVKAPVKAPVTPPQAPKPEAPKAPKDPRALPVKPPAKLPVTPPQPKAPRGLVNVGVGADVLNHDNKAASNKPKTTDKSNGNHGPAIVDVAVHKRDDAPSDTDILQYALTLEHLEKAFYDGALEKFNHKAFAKAGLPPIVRDRFEQIAAHEAEHVSLLTSAIGATANAACNYTFPYHDPKSFAALSMVLEGVGVSAYLGAAQFIQSKEYLTVAGSILTTESRHASWVASTVNKVSPWSGPFDTPLDLDQVFSLASQFITGCPSTNVNLPVKAFPTLSIKNKKYGPGDEVTLQFDATSANGEPTYLVIYSGLTTYYATIENDTAKLPAGLEGTSYGLVSTSNTTVTDSNTIAGMLVFEFYNPSYTY